MKFRWKLLLLLLTIAIVPILMGRTFGVHTVRKLGAELVSQSRGQLVKNMENRMQILVDSYSAVLQRGREQIEMALILQAREVELALAGEEVQVPEYIYFAHDFNKGTNLPPDTVHSSFHFRTRPDNKMELLRVSYSYQVFKLAPGVATEDARKDIARLSRLTPVYRTLSGRLKEFVLWYQTSLENGLHGAYPGHNAIPRKLDARTQPWYRQAFERAVPWSDPYVDPETRQIVVAAVMPVKRPNGEVAGVTSLVLSISRLLSRRILFQNIPPATKSFMCYLGKDSETNRIGARIFARKEHSDLTHRSWRAQLKSEWLSSDDAEEFQTMLKDIETASSNTRRMPYKGRDSLWALGPTAGGAFLVLITPYEEILKPALQSSRYISGNIDALVSAVGYFGLGIITIVIILAFTFSRTVTRSIRILNEGVKQLAAGHFDTRVEIRSRDEFGEMGQVFNSLGPRLKELYQMRQGLELAREVQQNLLPKTNPKIEGLDIVGSSIYCEKTGGDYYDFLTRSAKENNRITVIVGDVSDHGIPSALLMTTARALLRQRSSAPGAIKHVVTDVNRQLTEDIEESGQFMTLFYCEIDSKDKWIRWVRAGHDPAIVYDPATGSFRVLLGRGVALGILKDIRYEEYRQDIHSGQIILIGTDGIWEAHNSKGEMFGKEKLRDIIRNNAAGSAKQMMKAIIDSLRAYRTPLQWEDDITLVIVKVL
ncbi:MAG: SpoIIE family protein phosphatase [Deltaproteobacteria bacterium]|nr:SpoIIE family protein phosphatase [Deltaproteobacteria bacterium]MBW2154321.1 SpoIIE family protein phosphatase [Deltaproteobacteria bacterium]